MVLISSMFYKKVYMVQVTMYNSGNVYILNNYDYKYYTKKI